MLMFDKIRSKVGKKAHDAKILIKIKSKDFAMSRKITLLCTASAQSLSRRVTWYVALGTIKQFNFKKNNGFN